MPAGRPPLDPEIKRQRRQESLKCYAAKKADVLRAKGKARMSAVRAKIAEMDWKERKQHRVRVAEDSERYRDRRDQKEREEQGSKQAVKTKQRRVERDVLRVAHGLPPIPPNQQSSRTPHRDQLIRLPRKNRPPRADRGMKGWQEYLHRPQRTTTPPGPKNDRATPDDSDYNLPTHRAAMPPIYEGGITASTRATAPMKCPECDCEGCPGCICMCPASTDWIEHADGQGHFFPTCTECGGTCTECGGDDCPGCCCICPHSTLLKDHGGHFGL
ncbi:hypothetical protein B0H14DRAFT_2605644 [Mycena olivaceomarginata]|nr:hypothetical protein B0H14DRAFT_2605644 [Mycena olivaceomarginata]